MAEYAIPTPPLTVVSAVPTLALDSVTDAFAALFLAPKTGTINQIWVRCSAVTSSPVYRAGVEGVSATKTPSGTYLSSGNAYVDFTPTVGSEWRTLTNSVSVTRGDTLAATVRYQSGTIGGSNFATFASNITPQGFNNPHSAYLSNTTGSWAIATNWPNIALQYDDGSVFGFGADSVTSVSWNSSSNPLVRGNLFSPSVDCYLSGVAALCRLQLSNASARVAIYDGTTELESITHSFDLVSNTGNPSIVYWPVRRLLSAGSSYRFTIEPTTASNLQTFYDIVFNSSLMQSTLCMGNLTKSTSTTRGGAWTDTANSVFSIWPIIGSVDVSSGGGVPLIGTGGLVY